MCVVTLSDKLTAPALTRPLFSALMILIVDHRRRRDLKLTPAHTHARSGYALWREASC